MPHLAIVAVVGKPHLGPDQENLAIETDNTAVVPQVPVEDGHANVEKDAMGALVLQKPGQHLQAVCVDIELMEVVQTRVPADF